jgi:DNA-binding NarL/FixJ family response regulator
MAIRIVLGEDDLLVREGLLRLLAARDGVDVLATAEDEEALLNAIELHDPDVVVTDIRMPPTQTDEGIRVAARLYRTRPETGVVILSQYADAAFALALLEHGSRGRAYLLKERLHDVTQLIAAIDAVAAGGSLIDPRVVESLVAGQTAGRSRLAALTTRELDVLREMAGGRNNAAIAEFLVVTENSVQKYITSIFAKLGVAWEPDVHRRVRAVLMYLAERDAG